MPLKINIGTKEGKTWKLDIESEAFDGKELNQTIKGEEFYPELAGYEFEITGASDKAGFSHMNELEGVGLGKILLNYGKGMKKRPKHEGKRKRTKNRPKGLRLRKTFRGKIISKDTHQINLKILKVGGKKLNEVFTDQSKSVEASSQ